MTTSQSFERIICGRKLTLETGKLAGAGTRLQFVTEIHCLSTSVAPKAERHRLSPLTVDYEERCMLPGIGGFRAADGQRKAILTDRLTDPTAAPAFTKACREIQQLPF